jgi:hypothetical protein
MRRGGVRSVKIGLGLVTCGRPDFYRQALAGIEQHLGAVLDELIVFEDGSILEPYATGALGDGGNHGVGHAKNHLLRSLLDAGCDWLILSEDDVVVDSPEAVTGYIRAAEQSGYGHLMFHAHGPHNPTPLRVGHAVTEWPNYVGAWCLYSRRGLETCGLMDEAFWCCWEHVEHSLRLAAAGFTPPWRGAADATGSEAWLHEIPGAIEHSAIRQSPRWEAAFDEGKRHWKETQPATYAMVFGG